METLAQKQREIHAKLVNRSVVQLPYVTSLKKPETNVYNIFIILGEILWYFQF